MKSGMAHTCSSGSRVEVGDSETHGYPWLQSKSKTSLGYTRPWLLKKKKTLLKTKRANKQTKNPKWISRDQNIYMEKRKEDARARGITNSREF